MSKVVVGVKELNMELWQFYGYLLTLIVIVLKVCRRWNIAKLIISTTLYAIEALKIQDEQMDS